jgi:signal transduction histidine kinase
MNQLLDELTENFSELITEKGIELKKEYRSTLVVNMNPALAEILLTNLISNAIKHNLHEGKINIMILECELVISNTGYPLNLRPEELFRRFSKDSSKPESLGLGLAIVRKIADTNNIIVDYTCKNDIHTLRVLFDKKYRD